MRLTTEQIKQGLLHENLDIRQQCLDYFTGMWSQDESVMPIVMQVIDARGRGTFSNFYDIDQLAQTDATIEWVINSLRTSPESFDDLDIDVEGVDEDSSDDEDFDDDDADDGELDDDDTDFRHYVLLNATGDLLQRHRDDVLSVLPADLQSMVVHRLGLQSESADVLWKRLEDLCEQFCAVDDGEEFLDDEADDLVITLAERGSVPVDRMMELLQQEVPNDQGSVLYWLEPLLIKLAGLIRHEPALPILVAKLGDEGDYVCEAAKDAIIRLGSDDAVRTIEELFPDEDWNWLLFAADALGGIHTDEAIRSAGALLQDEMIEEDVSRILASGLARQFSTEGLQTLAEYLDSRTDWLGAVEWIEVLEEMQTSAKLMSIDLPRLQDWRTQLMDSLDARLDSTPLRNSLWDDSLNDDDRIDDDEVEDDDLRERFIPAETIIHEGPRVGRNDPCPCGSGKKFKKCCLGKADAN